MAFLLQENTNLPRFQPHFASLEHRPMLLKDFLRDDASSHSRTPSPWSTVALSSKSNKPHIVLLRSWSKRAAATKISAVHKVIKLLQFASMKSPSVLPRSISRKLTKRQGKGDNDIFGDVSEVKVKVKDILRWRSFRDLAEEDDPTPFDFPPSPDLSTAAATATTTTTTTSCSKRSSWCDSDFTAEELPPWGGENDEFSWGRKTATLKNPKGDWSFEEYEQQSPVSVLDSHISPFHPANASTVQRGKFNNKHSLEGVNAAEEKAKQLVSHVTDDDDGVILDFFTEELSIDGKLNDDEFDGEILRIAESWLEGGELEESYEWEVEEKRGSFVKDMERGVCWDKFSEEQQELCKEMEIRVFNDLIDHLVADFVAAR